MAKKMTNAEKFRAVFGEDPDTYNCPICCYTDCPYFAECKGSGNGHKWWDAPYTAPHKEVKE